jgi:hypothetical protein
LSLKSLFNVRPGVYPMSGPVFAMIRPGLLRTNLFVGSVRHEESIITFPPTSMTSQTGSTTSSWRPSSRCQCYKTSAKFTL